MQNKRTQECTAGCLSAVEMDESAWPYLEPIINGNRNQISRAGQAKLGNEQHHIKIKNKV